MPPLEIKKQGRENTQSLVRRFGKRIRQSGILRRARKVRFFEKGQSPQLKKRSALRRIERRKEYFQLRKLGKTERRKN